MVSLFLFEITSHNHQGQPVIPGRDVTKLGRTDGMTDTFPQINSVFIFYHASYHITVVWSCNLALWIEVSDASLLSNEWRICLVVRLWTSSDQHSPVQRCQLTLSHRRQFVSLAALLLLPLADHSASVTFTQTVRQNSDAGFLPQSVWKGLQTTITTNYC